MIEDEGCSKKIGVRVCSFRFEAFQPFTLEKASPLNAIGDLSDDTRSTSEGSSLCTRVGFSGNVPGASKTRFNMGRGREYR